MLTWSGLLFFVSLAFAGLRGSDVVTGKAIEVSPGAKGTVAVFLSARCPCSNSHIGLLKALASDFNKDFNFVAIHSNSNEPAEEAKTYFLQSRLPFPVLRDESFKLANQFKALRTPHAFVIAPDGQVLFKGGVTDSSDAPSASRQWLRQAVEEIAAGKPVRVSEVRSLGCTISR